jgi:hypothetical protein
MRGRDTGLTLPQILIVVTIVVILSALGLAAFGPQIRRQAHEGQIRRDLQAWVVALNIYKNDYDNLLPAQNDRFEKSGLVPMRAPSSLTVMNGRQPITAPRYEMMPDQAQLDVDERQGRLLQWDAAKNSIVSMPFLTRPGKIRYVELKVPQPTENWETDGFVMRVRRWRQEERLAAFLDGRVSWTWDPQEYQFSTAIYNTFFGWR